jgi:hypothetical protein
VGPLAEKDWGGADWIGGETQRQIRGSFELNASTGVAFGLLHVAAPGCAMVTVNGKPVAAQSGDGDAATGICPWSSYGKTILYQTYDVSAQLVDGENVIGLLLGHGTWFHTTHAESTARVLLNVAVSPPAHLLSGSPRRHSVISGGGAPLPGPHPPHPPGPPTPPAPPAQSLPLCCRVHEHGNVTLHCPACPPGNPCSSTITAVTFASFGQPTGECDTKSLTGANNFAKDLQCDANAAMKQVQGMCVSQKQCTLLPSCTLNHCHLGPKEVAFPDPCQMQPKHLDVAVQCGDVAGIVTHDDGGATAIADVYDLPPPGLIPSVWKATDSYIWTDDPWVGTIIDWSAHAATVGWDSPGSKVADGWRVAANTWPPLVAKLPLPRANMLPPTAVIRTLKPTRVDNIGQGSFVYTFPENFVGVLQVGASHVAIKQGGAAGGGKVAFQHSEVLANGTEGKRPIDAAWAFAGQTDTHSFGPDWKPASPTATLTPRFVWHGGQFVQVTVSGDASFDGSLSAVTALVMHANLTQTGNIKFSGGDAGTSSTLNGLNKMILNSQTSNVAAGMPTDCPTREKRGWLGDAQVTAEEAIYNFDMASVYTEYLNSIRDDESLQNGNVPGSTPADTSSFPHGAVTSAPASGHTDISWSSAYPLIAHWVLAYYGDEAVVLDHWPTLNRYMDGLMEGVPGVPSFWTWGDWCAVESRAVATPGTGPELAAFNFILSVDAMADMATAIGDSGNATKWHGLSKTMRSAFHTAFFNESMQRYGNGHLASGELLVQSLNAAPLALGLDSDGSLAGILHDDVVSRDYHVSVGSVGAKHLLPQLSANGHHEDAMRVATQTSFPSFGYWLAQGATTCWEDYSGQPSRSHPPTPTHNHIFLCGGAGEWMYRSVLGVAPTQHGWKTMAIHPQLSATGPTVTNGSVHTIRGKVEVAWVAAARGSGGSTAAAGAPAGLARLDITIPAGSTATVAIPVANSTRVTISEGGAAVWAGGTFHRGVAGISAGEAQGESGVTLQVSSGSYKFKVASDQ